MKNGKEERATFNFGDPAAYTAGGGVPEGDYEWTDVTAGMFDYQKKDGTSAGSGLCIIIKMKPIAGGEEVTQPYSLGRKAHESWAPHPDHGKSLVPVPGGPGTGLNNSTNWSILLKSLWDSGMPQGILQDDLSVLEGIKCHMANVPEPEDRKQFRAATGEAGAETRTKMIPVVTALLDDGKPWEVEAKPSPKAKVASPAVAKTAATQQKSSATKVSTAPAATSENDEEVMNAAITSISTVLEKNPNGVKKLILRTSTFKEATTQYDQKMAQSVVNTFFGSDDALNGVLNGLGYGVRGADVVVL